VRHLAGGSTLVLAGLLAACGGGNSLSGSVAHTTTTTTRAPTTTTAPAVPQLPGIGATDASWEAHHTQDHRFAAGSSYDPNPALADPSDPSRNDKYYAVAHQSGHVIGFSTRYTLGTTIDAAKTTALAEFPPDATVVWSTSNDTCAQMQVRSPTLRAALSAGYGDPTGGVAIAFYTNAAATQPGSYRADNIRDAIFLAVDEATPSDAPAC
jgi:hypothetical protein